MNIEEFQNSIDGSINDFESGEMTGAEFRTAIMGTLIAIATPHLNRKPNDSSGLLPALIVAKAELKTWVGVHSSGEMFESDWQEYQTTAAMQIINEALQKALPG